MRNRRKTLLRDHLVLEVTLKACPRHYSVSAIPEINCQDRFDDIISKGSDDIGKTLLVEMDIDTGDSPPIASKPYTLSLKHYDWVQKEITTLERAGIITKSISPWASPVVIVPKKSAPGEPPPEKDVCGFQKTEQTTT